MAELATDCESCVVIKVSLFGGQGVCIWSSSGRCRPTGEILVSG